MRTESFFQLFLPFPHLFLHYPALYLPQCCVFQRLKSQTLALVEYVLQNVGHLECTHFSIAHNCFERIISAN